MNEEIKGLTPLMPMLYIAWSDAVLSPTELRKIKTLITDHSWLSQSEKTLVENWLDPSAPPSVREINSWLNYIRKAAAKIPVSAKRSLAQIAIEIAKVGEKDQQKRFSSPEAKKALLAIEEALGVISYDAFRKITTVQPELEKNESEEKAPSFDVHGMLQFLDGKSVATKKKMRQLLQDPFFDYLEEPTKEEYREQVLVWCKALADQGFGSLSYPAKHGGKADMQKYITVFEMLGHHDISLAIKFGVQFGLFGGSVLGLGTERHHKKYLKKIGTLELPGCFAMTEYAHGSNVKDVETAAKYDTETQEFVINTPHYYAHKEYIGNAACHGEMATVFAQLETQNENHGVHAFLVPIRNTSGESMPGVKIADSGFKLGLNGVDNGRLWFENVRIPKENLLNRFGDVSEDGEYQSPIPGTSKRFFTMLSTLVGGRVSVPLAGLSAAKSALTIAIRYGAKRKQFGPPDKQEVAILDYQTHQRRLLPLLAKCYALDFAQKYVLDRYVNRTEKRQP